MVGDINVSQQELEQRHTRKEIIEARVVYGLLMYSMTGGAIAEFLMQKSKSLRGVWQELENYYMSRTLAATHRLKRDIEEPSCNRLGTYRPTARGYTADAPAAGGNSDQLDCPIKSCTTGTEGGMLQIPPAA